MTRLHLLRFLNHLNDGILHVELSFVLNDKLPRLLAVDDHRAEIDVIRGKYVVLVEPRLDRDLDGDAGNYLPSLSHVGFDDETLEDGLVLDVHLLHGLEEDGNLRGAVQRTEAALLWDDGEELGGVRVISITVLQVKSGDKIWTM